MKHKHLIKSIQILAIVILSIICKNSNAQISNYVFNQTYGNYDSLINATILDAGTGIDNQTYLINLPFSFEFNNTVYNDIHASANGYITFGNSSPGAGYYLIANGGQFTQGFSAFDTELASYDATTKISYKTVGFAPNRKLVIEWKNFGFPISTAFKINFQIQLTENNDSLKAVYGVCNFSGTGSVQVQVGIKGTSGLYQNRASTGSFNSTNTGTSSISNINFNPSSSITSGLNINYAEVPCATPNGASNLVLTPGPSNISGSFTASTTSNVNYLVVKSSAPLTALPTNGVPYLTGDLIGNGTVILNSASTTFNNNSLPSNTTFYYTVFTHNNYNCINGTVYNTANSISNQIATTGPKAYTFLPTSGTASFALPTNWMPLRTLANSGDTLIFDQGGNVVVNNIAGVDLSSVMIKNNTTARFVNNFSNSTFFAKNLFLIESGSTLIADSAGSINFKCTGFSSTLDMKIDGSLILEGLSTIEANNMKIVVNGLIKCTSPTAQIVNATTNNLKFVNGTYHHARNGGTIPAGLYNINSTVLITNAVANFPAITTGQDFGNLIIDCPNLTGTNIALNIDTTNNLSVLNTNSIYITISSPKVLGDFTQSNANVIVAGTEWYGNMNLNSGTLSISGICQVKKNLNQLVSHTIVSPSASNITLFFNGIQHQNINIGGTSASSPLNYELNNLQGATLTGIFSVGPNGTVKIAGGGWDGTGFFSYDVNNTSLKYVSNSFVKASTVEWPSNSYPYDVVLDLQSNTPTNTIWLPGNRTLKNLMHITNGILALGNYDLLLDSNSYVYDNYYFSDSLFSFIAADSIGKLIVAVKSYNNPFSGFVFGLRIGSLKNGPTYSSLFLILENNPVPRYLSINLSRNKHPFENATTNYLNRYWTISDNQPNVPFTYSMNFNFPNVDIIGSNNLKLNRYNASVWTQKESQYNMFSSVNYSTFNLSPTNDPISGDYTARQATYSIYTWNGSISNDYQLASNWTPARTVALNNDHLIFNNGQVDTIQNIASENVGNIKVLNNTSIYLAGPSTNTNLYLLNDYDSTNNELTISNGSAIYLIGTLGNFTFGSGSFNNTLPINMQIDGRLEVENITSNKYNKVDFNGSIAIISSQGTIAAIGNNTNSYNPFLNASLSKLFGTYEHKYINTEGHVLDMKIMDGSNYNIIGYTSLVNGSKVVLANSVFNLNYNCPNQSTPLLLSNGFLNVRGSFNIVSTGTSLLNVSNSFTQIFNINNYNQTNGSVVLSFGTNNVNKQILNINNSFIQSGGSLIAASTGVSPVINFTNSNAIQNVSFYQSAPLGNVTYRISNPFGIQLGLSNATTSNFDINTNGGIIISSPALVPISTSLILKYASMNTTLTYDSNSNIVATNVEFPSIDGPENVTVNIQNNKSVTLPFDRTIRNKLTMTKGIINIGSHQLSLGTSSANIGSLLYQNGRIDVSTGLFTRWLPTAGLPTSYNTNIGFFPIGNFVDNRFVSFYFSSSGGVSNAGTISVGHIDAINTTSGLNIIDGANTITNRTNSYWQFFAGNGISLNSSTISMALQTDNLLNIANVNRVFVTNANSVVGTHAVATGTMPNFRANRIGLTLNDLTANNFYIGSDSTINPSVFSVNNGDWNTASTWNINAVPAANQEVIISNGTTVSNTNINLVKSITVSTNGLLQINSNSNLQVDSFISNFGSIVVNNDSLRLGNYNGDNSRFFNYGSFIINAGVANINGALINYSASTFTQNNGKLLIDGNAGGVFSKSITDSLLVFYSKNCNFLGGEIIIIDPPSKLNQIAVGFNFIDSNLATSNHSFVFGNGISTDSSNLKYSITANGLNTKIGNIVHKGSKNNLQKDIVMSVGLQILGNVLLQDSNAIFTIQNGKIIKVKGNIFVNANNIFVTSGTILFNGNTSQQVTGNGNFKSALNTNTANFASIEINNISIQGVVFNIGNVSFSSSLRLANGILDMNNNILIQQGAANLYVNIPGSSWVKGSYEIHFGTTGSGNINYEVPLGNASFYTPVFIAGSYINNSSSNQGGFKVSMFDGDHPSISSSNILATKTINKHFIITPPLTGQATIINTNINFSWKNSEIDFSVNIQNLVCAKLKNNSWINYYPSGLNTNSAIISTTSNGFGEYQIGEINQSPLVSLQPLSDTICENTSTNMQVTTNLPCAYQWQLLTNNNTWQNLVNNSTYTGVLLNNLQVNNAPLSINNSKYRCRLITASDTQYSGNAVIIVNPILLANITITSSIDTACANTSVSFTPTFTNAGTAYQLEWFKNGVSTSNTNFVYTTNTLTSTDFITCKLTSNAICVANPVSISNAKSIFVIPLVTPSISISANPGINVCPNTNIAFTANAINVDTANITYQWRKNGVNIAGATASTYSSATLVNNNSITCAISTSQQCGTTSIALSNILLIGVSNPVTQSVTINSNVNTSCPGNLVTYFASPINGGNNPTYQWFVNNSLIANVNSANYTYVPAPNDSVFAILTSSLGCLINTTDTSNFKSVLILSNQSPIVNIVSSNGDSICTSSNNTTLSYSAQNIGTNTSLAWYLNGSLLSTNSQVYYPNIQNNDQLFMVLTTTNYCSGILIDTSNVINFSLIAPVTGSMVITSSNNALICKGSTDTFTAIGTYLGTNLNYQWFKNNLLVSTNSNTYIASNLLNSDNIACSINSNYYCITNNYIISNTIAETVLDTVVKVLISSFINSPICAGTPVSFTAQPITAGSTPTYQWLRNGVNISGATSNTHVVNNMNTGDVISCVIFGNNICAVNNIDTSNALLYNVLPVVVPTVSITASPGVNIAAGQSVVFSSTSTNAGNTPQYQWQLNGVNVSINTTYTSASLQDNDEVSLILTSSNACAIPTKANSNTLTMKVSVGIQNIEKEANAFAIVPNPNNGKFTIVSKMNQSTNDSKYKLKILNNLGQIIKSENINLLNATMSHEVDISENVAKGTYILILENEKEKYHYKILIK